MKDDGFRDSLADIFNLGCGGIGCIILIGKGIVVLFIITALCSERSERSEDCTLEKGDIITLTLFESTRATEFGTISIISYAHCEGIWSTKKVFRVYFPSNVHIPGGYRTGGDDRSKYLFPPGVVLQVKIGSMKSQSSYSARLIKIL